MMIVFFCKDIYINLLRCIQEILMSTTAQNWRFQPTETESQTTFTPVSRPYHLRINAVSTPYHL